MNTYYFSVLVTQGADPRFPITTLSGGFFFNFFFFVKNQYWTLSRRKQNVKLPGGEAFILSRSIQPGVHANWWEESPISFWLRVGTWNRTADGFCGVSLGKYKRKRYHRGKAKLKRLPRFSQSIHTCVCYLVQKAE